MYDAPVPGWYHDPTNPGAQRWWDGSQWGDAVAPLPAAVYASAPMPAPPLGYAASPYVTPPMARPMQSYRSTSFGDSNRLSLITLAVAAAYLVAAVTIHLVLIGFIPISFALRANASKEPLRHVALGAAIVVVIIGVLSFVA